MKKNYAPRLQRQLKHLLQTISQLRKNGNWTSFDADKKKNLLARVRHLLNRLRQLLPRFQFKHVLGAVIALTGFSMNGKAQSFGAKQINPFGIVNVDTLSMPAAGDLDNDGDLDLIYGNHTGDFTYLQNTGTPSAPAFGSPQINPFGLTNGGGGYLTAPAMADLDNDGDLDIILGDLYANFVYFQNTGSASAPTFGAPQTNPFGLSAIANTYTSTPTFVDLDNDGDLDLMVGDYYGDYYYFENTGTASAPAFGAAQMNPFGLPNSGYNTCPTFSDMDGDGDLDLLTGEYYGDFYYFENTGTVSAPAFAAPQTNPFGLAASGTYWLRTILADFDNDGDDDLLTGEYYGDSYYYENTSPVSVQSLSVAEGKCYPNPFHEQVQVDWKGDPAAYVLMDARGAMVMQGNLHAGTQTLDLAALSAGVYHLQVKGDSQTHWVLTKR